MARAGESPILRRLEPTLPTPFYLDPEHHRRELEALWYRHWLCVGRSRDWPQRRDYRLIRIADQEVIVTRDLEGRLRAFHNTCRHRGSILCEAAEGRFRGGGIVCPYHGWTYSLEGELQGARHQLPCADFRREDHSLYRVAVDEWAGFVFLNLLGDDAAPLDVAEMASELANWPLQELVAGHRVVRNLECNWKVFWENFCECFHCPGVHPELVRIVPIYARGLQSTSEDPGCGASDGLAEGAVTWSLDGRSTLPGFPGLTEAERRRGHTFGMLLPSFFLVGHVDYVRFMRMRPLAPERTELTMEWLFPPAVLERPDLALEHAVALGERVMEQDARVCELNQRGLRCRRHRAGVLVPQEYLVRDFHRWVLGGLGEAG